MYRQAQKMEQEQIANDHFVTRLGSLPVVNSAWNQACGMYQKTKDSNGIIRATCNMAETGVQTMYSTAKPVMDKYQPQIEQVNSFACQKLALMEENYPVITKPTDELWKDGQEKCTEALKPITNRVNTVKDTYNGIVSMGHGTIDAAKGRVEAAKEYGYTQVSKTLETPVGKFALEKVNEALTLSEEYIEKYLPEAENEGEAEKECMEVDEVNAFTRVSSISTKLRQRLFRRAMKDLNGLQVRSKEKLENLNFTVDLIQYAKQRADGVKDTVGEKYEVTQKRVMDVWEQINQDGDDEEESPVTMEERTIVVARRLTHHVRQGLTTVSGYVPTRLQPQVIRERIENARKYTDELYQSFKQAKGYDDIPSWVLTQTKDKMAYVTETVSFLWDTFLVSPVNWLVPARGEGSQPGEIEMEPMEKPQPEEE